MRKHRKTSRSKRWMEVNYIYDFRCSRHG
jgi:hypothetical protein